MPVKPGTAAVAVVGAVVAAAVGVLGASFISPGTRTPSSAPTASTAVIGQPSPSTSFSVASAVPASVPPAVGLGGKWSSPAASATIKSTKLTLSVTPSAGEAAIKRVTFTAAWSGTDPRRACTALSASGTKWSCTVDLGKLGVRRGDMTLSFDVVDGDGAVARAPDGVRTVSYAPPIVATRWSSPRLIARGTNCDALVAAIDGVSGNHVAASCDGRILYAASNTSGSWSSRIFTHPARRRELEPELAFQGKVAYIAYSRIALADGGCGDSGQVDVGVWYRQRTLPGGAWSQPKQLGRTKDRLLSFRVAGGILHATVRNDSGSGGVFYETVGGGVTNRYRLPDAAGDASLRVGSDGRARIAYEAGGSIRYAIFNGSGFTTSRIPGSTGGSSPLLVLGAGNQAHVMWVRTSSGGGCAEPGPFPEDGTYYATNPGDTWQARRVTKSLGWMSLSLDPVTGRVHAIIESNRVRYYTKAPTGPWQVTTVPGVPATASSPVIRVDPATGRVLLAYIASVGSGAERIYAVSKP
jgi:hypothetical protein